MSGKRPTSFLDLPFEIRELIYQEVVSQEPGIGITRPIDGLVLANRTIGEEAKEVYYIQTENASTLGFTGTKFTEAVSWVSSSMEPTPGDLLEATYGLLSRCVTSPIANGRSIRLQKGINPSLRKLTIKFSGDGVEVVPKGRERGGRADLGDHREHWIPFSNGNRYRSAVAFTSEEQLEEMVAALTKGMSEELKVEVEFWGLYTVKEVGFYAATPFG